MTREFTDASTLIEDNCFKAIKYSLEIPIIPIRKFLILFYIYLKMLFGETHEIKPEWKNLKF